MMNKFPQTARFLLRKTTIWDFARPQVVAILLGGGLAAGFAVAAESESATQMMVSGRGHGILFDGEARKQANVPDGVAQKIWEMQDQLTEWRRHLHMHPELSDKEENTHKFLIKTLTDMGLKPEPFGPSTGIIVNVPGVDKTFTIGVRADIDALPFTEVDDGREYRSKNDGVMHACGHDAHTTVALGVAKSISDGLFKPPVNLRFIFQPAEEIGKGAQEMVDAGVLEGVDVVVGLHSDPTREWGRIGLTAGTFSAYANGFVIEVDGLASHGGMSPEKGLDAIVAASYLVTQLQTIVSRNVAPPDASTISVGTFQAGNAANQIADKAVLNGTMRAQDRELYQKIRKRMTEVVEGASTSFGMPIKIDFPVEMPGTENNENMFNVFKEVAETVIGPDNVDVYTDANMAGEDFAAYSQVRPSFFYWLGIANNEKNINSTLHTVTFDIDERALPVGVALQLAQIKKLAEYHASGGKF